MLDLVSCGKFVRFALGAFKCLSRNDSELLELLIDLRLGFGVAIICAHRGSVSPLRHQIALDLHFQVLVFGFSGLELEFGILSLLLSLRIAQVHDDGVGFDLSAGEDASALYSSVGERGNPSNIDWNESSKASNLPQHWAPFHGIGPYGGAFNARSCWLES